MRIEKFDALIIGSGPSGATYARALLKKHPHKTILMVEAGSQLSRKAGTNAKNFYLYNRNEDGLDALSNVVKGELTIASTPVQDPWPETLNPIADPFLFPEPGKELPTPAKYAINGGNPDQQEFDNMPAGSSSFNVGGMGAHWTCCTPVPVGPELDGLVPLLFSKEEFDGYIARAQKILKTNQVAFINSQRGQVIEKALKQAYQGDLPADRGVQMLPLACQGQAPAFVTWTGVDTILEDLADPLKRPANFVLWQEHLCRELYTVGSDGRKRIEGALIENLVTREQIRVEADIVIVAANTLNTPQLLWKSNIRPEALGRYLNDQPMVFCQIVLSQALIRTIGTPTRENPVPIPEDDPIPQVWIPFSEEHPFHCQIHRDAFPYGILSDDLGIDHRSIVGLRWFAQKKITKESRITFSDTHKDLYDMPQVTFHYILQEEDRRIVDAALQDIQKAAAALGGYLTGEEPRMLPRGSSLHYMGTFRMGPDNDGTSVCDANSRVWEYENLFLGGNGIIPSALACNPTLTNVALALRAVDNIWN